MLEDDFNWAPKSLLVRSRVVLLHTADINHDSITGKGLGVIPAGRYIFPSSVKTLPDWLISEERYDICKLCGRAKRIGVINPQDRQHSHDKRGSVGRNFHLKWYGFATNSSTF